MHTLSVILDTLAVALLMLLAGSFILSAPRRSVAWLIGLLAFNYTCYLLSARHDYAFAIPASLQIDFGAWHPVVNLARNSISALLLLLAHALFRDDRRLPGVFLLMIATQLFLEEPLGWLLSTEWEQAHPYWKFFSYEFLPACFQVFFMGFAMYWAVGELSSDLVANRRATRVLMLCIVAVHGLLSVFIERLAFTAGFVAFSWMYPIHVTLVAIGILIYLPMVFWLLRRDLLDFLTERPIPGLNQVKEQSSENREVAQIVRALEQDRIYQRMGLTVADLAKHVALPEYRLRDLIHNRLGYRNFNAFLHRYRIEEVAAHLQDPEQNRVPILTLALSAGYQSINPFNRAFKELKQMTPSEYRASMQNSAEFAEPQDSQHLNPLVDAATRDPGSRGAG